MSEKRQQQREFSQHQILAIMALAKDLRRKTRQGGSTLFVHDAEKNIRLFIFLVDVARIPQAKDLKSCYDGLKVIITLEVPWDFPANPPVFRVLTENGYYLPRDAPCIIEGHYHQGEGKYNSVGGFSIFLDTITMAFVDPAARKESGVGIQVLPEEKCKMLAAQSDAYNREHHADLMALFDAEAVTACKVRLRVLAKELGKLSLSTRACESLVTYIEGSESCDAAEKIRDIRTRVDALEIQERGRIVEARAIA